MKFKTKFLGLLLAGSSLFFASSCKKKPNDAELKTKVETAVANSAVAVEVKEGVVTLLGTVADDAAKLAAEAAAKAVENVAAVTNSLQVTPPPPPVVVAEDNTLINAVATAVQSFKTVKADVKDGVVTLTGEIKKVQLPVLMQAIMALKPKSVDNKLTIK